MLLLHRIGKRVSSNWNNLEDILSLPQETQLSFDGIYTEVYHYYRMFKGRPITLFFSGAYLGGDNSFDKGELPGKFCTLWQLFEMVGFLNARLGYHGKLHRRCVGLSYDELVDELTPPAWSEACPYAVPKILAWPHGVCDKKAIEVAESLGYEEAYCAGPFGDGSRFQRKRQYLGW